MTNGLGTIETGASSGYTLVYPRLLEKFQSTTVEEHRAPCPTPQALWLALEDAMMERKKIAVLTKRGVIK